MAGLKEFGGLHLSTSVGFLGDEHREFMHRLSVGFHGMLGSYLRDALHEGGASGFACLRAPQS
jgi:hypothetical protein